MGDERLDGLFMNGVQQSQGIENFFDNLMGFFRRKTDFFSQKETGLKNMIAAFEKHEQIFRGDKERQDLIAKKRAQEKAAKEAAEKAKKEADESQCQEVTEEEAAQIEREEAMKKAAAQAEKQAVEKHEEKKGEEGEDDKEKGVTPNAQNGAKTDKYEWGQALDTVDVNIWLPEGFNTKQLNVKMTANNLEVKNKVSGDIIVSGKWFKPIHVDDSIWCIETDGKGKKFLQLNLQKKSGQNWWEYLLEGDAKINTQKVEPENSKLGDLDSETRGVVEKMMFDQRQKQMGLPSSDELEKKNKLEAFMKAHPEMDFSKAKFS